MIEVELKFEITPAAWPQLEQQLATMQFVRQLRNSDLYYDTADFDLLSQAVFVRVRNQARLEFKFNERAAPAHTHCTEQAFSLAPEPGQVAQMNALFSRFLPGWRRAMTVHEALAHNSLREVAQIENHRTQYAWEDLIVCLDRVEGLGDFLEIEMQCREERETHQALAQLERVAVGFALRPVRVGYVERWLQKHNPQAYLRGNYQEEAGGVRPRRTRA
jgi:adenylate cyclase class IV